mmetsp:Transcript_20314/g.33421  ORF Transcript_20314/g.33421 Transcript_20314/m.33421 type:complete len:101 (+) Transcript_20314:1432-1734(+)
MRARDCDTRSGIVHSFSSVGYSGLGSGVPMNELPPATPPTDFEEEEDDDDVPEELLVFFAAAATDGGGTALFKVRYLIHFLRYLPYELAEHRRNRTAAIA